MYRKPSTSPGPERKDSRPSLFLWLAPIAAMVAVLTTLAVMEKDRPVYNGRSCQGDAVIPRGHTIVVIDQTNALSDPALVYVKGVIGAEYRRLQQQDRLTVMGLRAAKGVPATDSGPSLFFTTCRVPRGDEVSFIDNNPALVEGQFEALVGQRLAALINSLKAVPEAPWSPIIETLESVSDDPMFSSSAIDRRLVLISDMMQNTKERSQYPRIAAKAKAPAPQFMRAHLLGVDVRVHYIFREGLDAIQSPDHEDFWNRYFTAAGVRSLQIGWGMSPDGRDQIAPIVWSPVPTPPVPTPPLPSSPMTPTQVPVSPPPARVDVPPAHSGTLPPGTIRVHGTRHAARGSIPAYINYEIDWQRIEDSDSLAFDARRVLLLTSHQAGRECYVSVPLVTRMARDPDGGQWGPGRLTRRLEAYEQLEQSFVQHLALAVGASFAPTTCEVIGARIQNRTDNAPRYRAVRCTGSEFSDIEEQDWDRLTHVTDSETMAARLAVVSGRHQLPPTDVSRIARSLEASAVCPTQPLLAPADKLLLGFRWLDEPTEPLVPAVEPVVSSRY